MALIKVFIESLVLLKKRPKIFVPRMITTLLYTLFIFFSARLSYLLAVATGRALTYGQLEPGLIISNFGEQIILLILTSIVVYVVDIVTYAMYPSIVADYQNNRDINLVRSLRTALRVWRTLLIFGAAVMAFLFLMTITTGVFYTITLITQNMAFIIPLLIILPLALLLFAVLFFFVIPIAVIENKKPAEAFRDSFRLGVKHRGPVLKTNLFFIGLTVFTIGVATLTEFRGVFALTAFLIFVTGRLIQALAYTYLSVVNPYLYLNIKRIK